MKKKYRPIKVSFIVLLFVFCTKQMFAQAPSATATINFDQNSGKTINQGAFGLNLFRGFDPNVAGTPGNALYKQGMATMKAGMVRCHSWEMLGLSSSANGWLLSDNSWDATKINNAMTGANANNPLIMMNIPGWPATWEDPVTKLLLPARYTDFANWCASLVRIININQGRAVKYWEVTNERDDLYKLQSDELGRIYNQAAAAMKAVDPTIKTGGPALARPDLTAQVDAFFSTAAPNLDFVSYHSYSMGTSAPPQVVYDNAVRNGKTTSGVKAEYVKYSARAIEYFHDEFNISWAPPDVNQTNETSMIFDALLMVTAVKDGATATHAWNEADGWYGKMDGGFNLRPSAYMFGSFNTHLLGGTVNNSTVSSDADLAVLASTKGSWKQFVVINRSEKDEYYKFNFTGLPTSVTGPALFYSDRNIATGGVVKSDITFNNLTGTSGALFPKNTVTILQIDVNNIRLATDISAPTVPAGLSSTSTDSKITLSWNASTDNVGVAGYNVFMNGVLVAGTTSTSYTATWLNPSTSYSFYVTAKDAIGNESAASATHTKSTTAYVARPVASTFTTTSWTNNFSGNVINDAGQTTTSAVSSALKQDEELRMILTNSPQYETAYNASFTNVINLSTNSQFTIDAKSNASLSLRVKLYDDAGNYVDAWQNSIALKGDGQSYTYTLNFATTGFGLVNSSRIKGIVLMYPDASAANGTVYLDNLKLGFNSDSQAPTAPSSLTASNITSSGFTVSWTVSTDNVGVTGYDVYQGTTLMGSSTTTSYTATGLTSSTAYSITVKAKDAAGNISAASTALSVTTSSSCPGTGSIRLDRFDAITGTAVSNLTSASKYPNTPDFTSYPISFEAPTNFSDSYGNRMTGFICPPTTGSYTFWIAGDDNVELWLSTTNSQANKTRIAYHTAWTNPREWNKYPEQKSVAITLQAGTTYYVEALMKEGGGGDNLAVGWAKPGEATTTPSEVIPGSALIPATSTISGSTTAYNIYTDNGTNNFANDGGTFGNYAMTVTNFTSGAPEGTNYRKIAPIDNYASYTFEYAAAGINKSNWSSAFLEFSIRTISDFDVFIQDAAGANKYLPLSSYMTKSGAWESVKIPISAFTGVNLSTLRRIGFYRLWNATVNMDFDNVRVTPGPGATRVMRIELAKDKPELSSVPFKVYPVPVIGSFTIETPGFTNPSIQILNRQGQVVFKTQVSEPKSVLSVQNLPAGVYVIQVSDQTRKESKKIIIEKNSGRSQK